MSQQGDVETSIPLSIATSNSSSSSNDAPNSSTDPISQCDIDGNSNDNDNLENTIDNSEESNDAMENLRKGTISSARFNILSTMVGGGSLSIPLAFHQGGNLFLAPLLLLLVAGLVEYSIYFLVQAGQKSVSRVSREQDGRVKGTVSYESTAMAAFGIRAKYGAMALVSTICFFTIIAYGVLLRDMLIPLTDYIVPGNSSTMVDGKPTFAQNISMLLVMLLITPLCTLQNLTALEKVGACSMASVVTLASCIAYRSFQCNFTDRYADIRHGSWKEYITLFPTSTDTSSSAHEFLNALPIFVNVFMCHFNVLPVHNELQNPTTCRVNRLFRTSIWGACFFYIFVGISGSMWGNCTESGAVEGNILLSFDEDDSLLTLGRACLTLTVTFAFPVLVVPARDVVLRGIADFMEYSANRSVDSDGSVVSSNNLSEPLLPSEDEELHPNGNLVDEEIHNVQSSKPASSVNRIIISVLILWTGALITCFIKSVDIVWDILGGSLSLMMGFFIPCGCFIKLSRNTESSSVEVLSSGEEATTQNEKLKRLTRIAWALILIFIPICLATTGNAIFNIINGDG